MKKLIGSLLITIGLMSTSIAAQVSLAWCPSPDVTVTNYWIYFSAGPEIPEWKPNIYATDAAPCDPPLITGTNWYRNYTNKVNVGNVTNANITGLIYGNRYYFSATAQNNEGLESEFCNEVMYFIPYPPIEYTFSLSTVNNLVTRGLQAGLIFTANTNTTTNIFLQITYSGTAKQGVDYSIQTNVYVFPKGIMSYTQYIDTIQNTVPDTNKTLIASLVKGTNYNVGISNVEFTLQPVPISYTNTLPTKVKDFQLLKMK